MQFTQNTIGDPELDVLTDDPLNLTATHPTSMTTESTTLEISAANCADAVAALYANGELIAVGQLSGGSGTLTFDPFPDVSVSPTLTLTGHNYIPYTAVIAISDNKILAVSPDQRNVSKFSGTTDFMVENTGTGSMAWTAAANDVWLTITEGESGINDGTITVNYPANPDPGSRTGSITITAPGAADSPQTVNIV
ncbi:MAG: hypothetical protein GY869_08590, partial [Planctomycetes bacterium]|nr:hypothetical protein [Planctomycetota bacterium]